MLQRTFLHLWGIGPWREKALWSEGVHDWGELQRRNSNDLIKEGLRESFSALEERDLPKWVRLLPTREHWRLYAEFANEALFFDVEADENRRVTVVSVFDHEGLNVFVAGRNLEELQVVMSRRRLWVTYNGAAFDVPVVLAQTPGIVPPVLHLDLKLMGRRMKWFGGLKKIESKLGFERPKHIQGLNGRDAILLWNEFLRNRNDEALRLLVEYNAFDSLSLKFIMENAFSKASEGLGWPSLFPKETQALEKDLLVLQAKVGQFGPIPRENQLIDKLRQETPEMA